MKVLVSHWSAARCELRRRFRRRPSLTGGHRRVTRRAYRSGTTVLPQYYGAPQPTAVAAANGTVVVLRGQPPHARDQN